MANVQYLRDGVYRVTYKDAVKSKQAGKRIMINKRAYLLDNNGQRIRNDYGHKAAIKARAKELLAEAEKAEAESARAAQGVAASAEVVKRTLAKRLAKQCAERPCYSRKAAAINAARRNIEAFLAWLNAHYPESTLEEFSRKKAEEYIASLGQNYTRGSVAINVKALKTAWDIVCHDDDLTLSNPWQGIMRAVGKQVAAVESIGKKGSFDRAWIERFFDYLGHGEVSAYFTLLLMTGWRKTDVLNLTSENVDLARRSIRIRHTKTADSTGAETILYLPSLAVDKIKPLIERAPQNNGKLFPFHRHKVERVFNRFMQQDKPTGYREIVTAQKRLRTHSMHTFRATAITLLKSAGYNNELVRYYVGHAPQSIEEKSYNDFATEYEKNTAPAAEFMARVIAGKSEPVKPKVDPVDACKRALAAGLTRDDLRAIALEFYPEIHEKMEAGKNAKMPVRL